MDFSERNHGFGLEELKYKFSGKKAVIETERIHNRDVIVIINFYNEDSFRADLKQWMEYQRQRAAIGENIYKRRESTQQLESFSVYKKLQERKITYTEFKDITTRVMARIIFEVMADHKDLLDDREKCIIQVRIKQLDRWIEGDDGAKDFDKLSHSDIFPMTMYTEKYLKEDMVDMEHTYLMFSGFYALQAIVGPFLLLETPKIEYQFLYRYLTHELDHYNRVAKGYFNRIRQLQVKMMPSMHIHSDYGLYYLYETLADLQQEGLAEFRRTQYTTRYKFDPKVIRGFKNEMMSMVSQKNRNAVRDYYKDHIYSSPEHSDVYAAGLWMCMVIAYSIDGKDVGIISRGDNKEAATLSSLASILDRDGIFFAPPMSKEAYAKAVALIGASNPFEFLEEYDRACKKLSIKEKHMVISRKGFMQIWTRCEYIFEKSQLELLKKEGYYPKL